MIEKFFDELVTKFVEEKASDVYLIEKDGYLEIKFLAANLLQDLKKIPIQQGQQLINFLKFKAGLMLSERRRPQTGSLVLQTATDPTKRVFGRLSTIGDFQGRESLVLRLIYRPIFKTDNFFFPQQLAVLQTAAQQKGLILFCGPVGSGKTTTMYQLAEYFSDQQVMTIEDPVEIYEPAFLQFQVNEQAGMTYLELLKAALRHRPEILIIGEIRDAKTARAAVDAALSGHIVFSTLHASCAGSALKRLLAWNLPPTDLLASIRLVNYQRLLPTVDSAFKILCEQLQPTQNWFANLENFQISAEWRSRLENCQEKKWITPQTKQLFWQG